MKKYDYKAKIIFNAEKDGILKIELKKGENTLGNESLTISHGFDNILIDSIDKLLARHNIDKASLKNIEIAGKIDEKSISGMVIRSLAEALRTK